MSPIPHVVKHIYKFSDGGGGLLKATVEHHLNIKKVALEQTFVGFLLTVEGWCIWFPV